jgi:hypothetical protein
MRREDIIELYYIAPLENVVSIYQNGLLSNKLASNIKHKSVAWDIMQERRDLKSVSEGRPIHEYVNLYICARNPMLYRIRSNKNICVLKIDANVLDLPGTMIADKNAARGFVRFYPSPNGLQYVDYEKVFAERWTHLDPIEEYDHKGIKCAEVLVPDRVDPRHIENIYVADTEIYDRMTDELNKACLDKRVIIDGHPFFRRC